MTEVIATQDEQAKALVAAEMDRQDRMWGDMNERADITNGQLHDAALTQLVMLRLRDHMGYSSEESVAAAAAAFFPKDWSGHRDYGSGIANLAVAAAFIIQEMKRRLRAGESTERTSRNPVTQPYTGDQPAVIEP